MVVVEHVSRLSKRRRQTSSESFPADALASIRAAVEAVPTRIFEDTTKHEEIGAFDASIADGLPGYEYEGDAAGGYNPNCKLGRILDSIIASISTTPTSGSRCGLWFPPRQWARGAAS